MSKIEDLEKRLELLQKDIAELKKDKIVNKRFRADVNYYFVSHSGFIQSSGENGHSIDNFRYNTRNYFETAPQAQKEVDRLIIKNKIMDIAEELNGDTVVDWSDIYQDKFYIMYSYRDNCIYQGSSCSVSRPEEIYCLDHNFVNIIKERLTKEEIELYFNRRLK